MTDKYFIGKALRKKHNNVEYKSVIEEYEMREKLFRERHEVI